MAEIEIPLYRLDERLETVLHVTDEGVRLVQRSWYKKPEIRKSRLFVGSSDVKGWPFDGKSPEAQAAAKAVRSNTAMAEAVSAHVEWLMADQETDEDKLKVQWSEWQAQ